MKKYILAAACAFIAVAGFAETDYDSFYYYRGEKYPLIKNPNKISALISDTSDTTSNTFFNKPSRYGLIRENIKYFETGRLETFIRTSNENSEVLEDIFNNQLSVNTDNYVKIPCYLGENGEEAPCTPYITIRLKDPNDSVLINEAITQYKLEKKDNGFIITDPHPCFRSDLIVSVTPESNESPIAIANKLYETGNFVACVPCFEAIPSICYDPDISKQWGMYNAENEANDINISSAWNYATGKNVTVAVLDNCVNPDHPDLKGRIKGHNNNFGTYDPSDRYRNHGTAVCGVIGAIRNNNLFGSGVAPDANLFAAAPGNSPKFQFTECGIENPDILNCSWYLPYPNELVECCIKYFLKYGRKGKGSVVCFAAGNEDGEVTYPANSVEDIFVVAGVTKEGQRWNCSCYGPEIDICAPATGIYVLTYENGSYSDAGTSFAAPYVAGVCALILEINPDLTGRQVMDIIEQTAKKIGDPDDYAIVEGRPNGTWSQYYGYGMVDAHAAVKLAKSMEQTKK